MNWDAIGAISETVSAFLILLTLLYLAFQIRQQNRQSKDASSQWCVEQVNAMRLLVMQDQEVAEMMLEGHQSMTDLNSAKEFQFLNYMDLIFATFWSQYQSIQNGTSDLTLTFLQDTFTTLGQSPGAVVAWQSTLRDRYPEDFRLFIDRWLVGGT